MRNVGGPDNFRFDIKYENMDHLSASYSVSEGTALVKAPRVLIDRSALLPTQVQ